MDEAITRPRPATPVVRRQWLIALAATVVLALPVWVYAVDRARLTDAVMTGEFVLQDALTARANCFGRGENAALRPGASVSLFGGGRDLNDLIARTELRLGTRSGERCTYVFAFGRVPLTRPTYELRVAGVDRGTVASADLAAHGWRLRVQQGPPTGSIAGSVIVLVKPGRTNRCVTSAKFRRIGRGTPVTVSDQTGRRLGSGRLGTGIRIEDHCVFPFDIGGIRHDQERYSLHVAGIGGMTSDRPYLESTLWHEAFILGGD